MNKQIRVLIKYPYKEAEEKMVESKLKTWQEIVDGLIECVPFPGVNGADIILNEEGKLERLQGNFWLPHYEDCLVGPAVIVGCKDGEFISLTDKQIEKAKKYINTFKLETGQDLYQNFYLLKSIMSDRMKKFDTEM